MSTCVLRFDNYQLPHNPKSINIYKDKTNEGEVSVISGTGEFYGDNCNLYINQLEQLFRTKKQGVLYIPEAGVFTAEMVKFNYSFSTLPNLVEYSFTFRQVLKPESDICAHYVAKKTETLWSLSKKLCCDVDTLINLNQGLINSYTINSGETIIVPNGVQEVKI